MGKDYEMYNRKLEEHAVSMQLDQNNKSQSLRSSTDTLTLQQPPCTCRISNRSTTSPSYIVRLCARAFVLSDDKSASVSDYLPFVSPFFLIICMPVRIVHRPSISPPFLFRFDSLLHSRSLSLFFKYFATVMVDGLCGHVHIFLNV